MSDLIQATVKILEEGKTLWKVPKGHNPRTGVQIDKNTPKKPSKPKVKGKVDVSSYVRDLVKSGAEKKTANDDNFRANMSRWSVRHGNDVVSAHKVFSDPTHPKHATVKKLMKPDGTMKGLNSSYEIDMEDQILFTECLEELMVNYKLTDEEIDFLGEEMLSEGLLGLRDTLKKPIADDKGKKERQQKMADDLRRRQEVQNQRKRDMLRARGSLTKEEVEVLDELSKKTLGSYVKKAAKSAAHHDDAASNALHRAQDWEIPSHTEYSWGSKAYAAVPKKFWDGVKAKHDKYSAMADYHGTKNEKRVRGIELAKKKMKKMREAFELSEGGESTKTPAEQMALHTDMENRKRKQFLKWLISRGGKSMLLNAKKKIDLGEGIVSFAKKLISKVKPNREIGRDVAHDTKNKYIIDYSQPDAPHIKNPHYKESVDLGEGIVKAANKAKKNAVMGTTSKERNQFRGKQRSDWLKTWDTKLGRKTSYSKLFRKDYRESDKPDKIEKYKAILKNQYKKSPIPESVDLEEGIVKAANKAKKNAFHRAQGLGLGTPERQLGRGRKLALGKQRGNLLLARQRTIQHMTPGENADLSRRHIQQLRGK